MPKTITPWGAAVSFAPYDAKQTVVLVHTIDDVSAYGVALTKPMPAHLALLGTVHEGWRWFASSGCAVPVAFPDLFSKETVALAKLTLRQHYPHAYRAQFGEMPTPAESLALQQAARDDQTFDKFTVVAVYPADHWNVPSGYVHACGWRQSDEAVQGFLVPEQDYRLRGDQLVLDGYPCWQPDRTLPFRKASLAYEVAPCRTVPGQGVETCEPAQAEFWGVYARPQTPDADGARCAVWISDHAREEEARAAAAALNAGALPATGAE